MDRLMKGFESLGLPIIADSPDNPGSMFHLLSKSPQTSNAYYEEPTMTYGL